MYCTSLGKVLLAFLDDSRQRDLLTRVEFVQRGPNTIVGKTALRVELKRVREMGFAVNNEELAYGLRSIAAPVRSQSGEAARRSTSPSIAR